MTAYLPLHSRRNSPYSLRSRVRRESCAQLPHQRRQDDEVREAKPRASRRRDHERVLGRYARPASRKRRQVSVAVAVENAVLTPVRPAFHHVEDLPALWMKRVRDPDRRGHFPGVTGS